MPATNAVEQRHITPGWTRASKFGGFGFLAQAKGPAYPIGYDVGGDHPVQATGNYLGLN
jgi:hypothetical protein